MWNDYRTLAGQSNEWVTSFVADSLLYCRAHLPDVQRTVKPRLRLLALRSLAGAPKGYNGLVPDDADSSAWYLSLLRQTKGDDSTAVRELRSFLAQHRRPDGGFATYSGHSRIRHFIRASSAEALQGWHQSHACTSAVVFHALSAVDAKTEAYIHSAQLPNGLWKSYWWTTDLYATYFMLQHVQQAGWGSTVSSEGAKKQCHIRLYEQSYVPNFYFSAGSPFETALAAGILLHKLTTTDLPVLQKMIGWLLRHQLPNGAWQSSALLRIPPPACIDPETAEYSFANKGSCALVLDQHGYFTTALVMRVLNDYFSRVGAHD